MKKNIIKLGIFIFSMFFCLTGVDAASFSVSANTNLTKGGKTTLTIRGSDVTGRFNISTSNSSVVSISEDRAWIENDSYSITLNALSVGSATITVTPSGVSDSSGNPVNLSSKSIKITVSLPREKSKDNNLKSLSIEGYEISPEFDKSVQVYSAVVPEGTKSINVKASASSSYASVSGAGNVELTEGANSVNVVVKSETGLEKIYTINVEVKDNDPIKVKIENDNTEYTVVKLAEYLEKPENYEETTVNINGHEIPAFKNTIANITLVGLKDSTGTITYAMYENGKYYKYNIMTLSAYTLMPTTLTEELDLTKTTITIDGEEIDAYKYNESDSLVIISAKNIKDGKTSMYLYDTKSKSVIPFDNSLIKITEEQDEKIKNYDYVIITLGGALILMLIIIICLIISLRKKQKKVDKFLKKQEAKIEATRKLNDVIDEVKKITESEKEQEKPEETIEEKEVTQETPKKKKKKDKKKDEVKVEVINPNELPQEEPKQRVVEEPTIEEKNIKPSDEDEVYDLFADDKKKKKKKR